MRTNPNIVSTPTRRDRNTDAPGPANPTTATVSPTDASRWTPAYQARNRARDDASTSQTRTRMQDTAVAALDIDQLNPQIRRDVLALMSRHPNAPASPPGEAGPSRTQQRDGDDDMVLG